MTINITPEMIVAWHTLQAYAEDGSGDSHVIRAINIIDNSDFMVPIQDAAEKAEYDALPATRVAIVGDGPLFRAYTLDDEGAECTLVWGETHEMVAQLLPKILPTERILIVAPEQMRDDEQRPVTVVTIEPDVEQPEYFTASSLGGDGERRVVARSASPETVEQILQHMPGDNYFLIVAPEELAEWTARYREAGATASRAEVAAHNANTKARDQARQALLYNARHVPKDPTHDPK